MARKNRVQVEDPLFNAAPTLAPRARPVDAFVNPGTPSPAPDTRLADLGSALAGFTGSIVDAGVASGRRMDDADFARAEADTRAAGGALSDAVRSGALRAGESPAYLRGLAKAQLEALGTLFDSEFKEAFSQSKARASDDPNAVQEFAAELQKKFADKHLGTYDPEDVAIYFEPKEIGAIKQVMANHREIRLARKEAQGIEAIGIQTSQLLSAYDAMPKELQNTQTLTDNMRAMVDPKREGSLTNLGLSQRLANDAIVKAGIEAAVANGDLSILSAVRNIPTHSGGRFGSITEYKKLFRAAEEHISKEGMRSVRDLEFLKGIKKSNESEKVVSQINIALEKGDHAGARSLLEKLNLVYPKLVSGMRAAIIASLNESFVRRMSSEQSLAMETALQTPGATVGSAIGPWAEFLTPQRMGLAFMTLRINREYRGFLSSNDYKDAEKGLITQLTAADNLGKDNTNKLISALDAPEVKAAFRRRVVQALSGKKDGQVLTIEELIVISKQVADNPSFGIGIAKEANEKIVADTIKAAKVDMKSYPAAPRETMAIKQAVERLEKMNLGKGGDRVGYADKIRAVEAIQEATVAAQIAQDVAERDRADLLSTETEFEKLVRESDEKAALFKLGAPDRAVLSEEKNKSVDFSQFGQTTDEDL